METKESVISGIKLTELNNSLRTGTDALLLSAYMRPYPNGKAVELGAGSGIISLLALKRNVFGTVFAVEIQKELSALCEKNAKDNGLPEKLVTVAGDLRNLSPALFTGVSTVFSNPPYMKSGEGRVSPSDVRQASRHEVFGGIEDFCRFAGKVLKTGGRFYTVYRPDRLGNLFVALKENGFSPKRMTFVCADEEHAPSSVLTEAIKDGSESLFLTPCLFINKNGENTPEIKEIYETGKFPERFLNK